MALLTSEDAYQRFKAWGYHSSHSVWFLMDLQFFESSCGWIFALQIRGKVALLPLDPLLPNPETPDYTPLAGALSELVHFFKVEQVFFVSTYTQFTHALRRQGYQILQIGEEPWIDLHDPLPKGNSGKGVRSARNHAIRAGVIIESWKWSELANEPEKRKLIQEIRAHWIDRRLFQVHGFLNTIDEFAYPEARRYFAAISPTRVEGVLIASQVPGIRSYYLEDMLLLPDAAKGTGELLTTEAMRLLQLEGAEQASLGVISLATLGASTQDADQLPKLVRFSTITLPTLLKKVVNFSGINVFRKRFKARRTEAVYVALKNFSPTQSDTGAWLRASAHLLAAFEPKLRVTWGWVQQSLLKPLQKYPVAWSVLALMLASFLYWNTLQGTDYRLPGRALNQFAFLSSAPLSQWWYRSLISDFMFFDRLHFLATGAALFAVLVWAERKHKSTLVFATFLLVSLFDDIINFGVLIKPFQFVQPGLFHRLISEKDVGCSLGLAFFSGLMICQFRRAREPIFVFISLAIVLTYTYSATRLQFLIINLNHLVFFSFGYLTGKWRFELTREQSRKAAKGKTPEVHPLEPGASHEKASATEKGQKSAA
jgi:hypothetical protein